MWIEIYILDLLRLLFPPWFFLWHVLEVFFGIYFFFLLLNFFNMVIESNVLNLLFFFLPSFFFGKRSGFLLWSWFRLFSSLFNFRDIIVETDILNLRFLNCFLFFCCRLTTVCTSVIWGLPIHKLGFMSSCTQAHAVSKILLLGCVNLICQLLFAGKRYCLFKNSLWWPKILLNYLRRWALLRSAIKDPLPLAIDYFDSIIPACLSILEQLPSRWLYACSWLRLSCSSIKRSRWGASLWPLVKWNISLRCSLCGSA